MITKNKNRQMKQCYQEPSQSTDERLEYDREIFILGKQTPKSERIGVLQLLLHYFHHGGNWMSAQGDLNDSDIMVWISVL